MRSRSKLFRASRQRDARSGDACPRRGARPLLLGPKVRQRKSRCRWCRQNPETGDRPHRRRQARQASARHPTAGPALNQEQLCRAKLMREPGREAVRGRLHEGGTSRGRGQHMRGRPDRDLLQAPGPADRSRRRSHDETRCRCREHQAILLHGEQRHATRKIVETDLMLRVPHRIRERPAARHDNRLAGYGVERLQPFGKRGVSRRDCRRSL